jgi:hypothetical protein
MLPVSLPLWQRRSNDSSPTIRQQYQATTHQRHHQLQSRDQAAPGVVAVRDPSQLQVPLPLVSRCRSMQACLLVCAD